MKLIIKNLTERDNFNFYTSIDEMEKIHKLDPFVESTVSGNYNLTITVDSMSVGQDGMLYIKKKYIGAEAILPIIKRPYIIIEMEA
jgi:hypothetical protein